MLLVCPFLFAITLPLPPFDIRVTYEGIPGKHPGRRDVTDLLRTCDRSHPTFHVRESRTYVNTLVRGVGLLNT